jgi:hypothetical protein
MYVCLSVRMFRLRYYSTDASEISRCRLFESEFNCALYQSNATLTLHEVQIDLIDFLKNP